MLCNKALLLKKTLLTFYNKNDFKNLIILKKLLNESQFSLRTIEWFCSNYSKKYNIIYKVNKKDFNVYLSYKSHLDSYHKSQFDLFKRIYKGYPPFIVWINDNNGFETTICQLNFFRWYISNNINDYMIKHLKEIKHDLVISMPSSKNTKNSKADTKANKTKKINNQVSKNIKENTDIKIRKKRQTLSVSANKVCIIRYVDVLLEF